MSNISLPVPTITAPYVTVFHGDAIELLRSIPDDSIDAVITDPPYAIASVGDVSARYRDAAGDPMTTACERCGQDPLHEHRLCAACLDDAEIEAFAVSGMLGQQSQNWHASATHSRGYADNDPAQFGRWCYLWINECLRVLKPGSHLVAFGGTRTWHRLATAAEDAGFEIRDSLAWLYATGFPKSLDVAAAVAAHHDRSPGLDTVGASAGSRVEGDTANSLTSDWAGWGTALKPAHEPIVLARKPLSGTVAHNVSTFGTGGLNIDGTRVDGGRWPSNVLLDDAQSSVLDDAADGRASRFFYVAKPDQSERVRVDGVSHPTVKPLTLMQELVRLVTPPGGVVLEPFAGSGTTVEACALERFDCIAIERDASYLPLIQQRIDRRANPVEAIKSGGAVDDDRGLFALFD